jgi:hypothetical protein
MASKAFGTQKRPAGKKFRDGLVGDALDDVYSDVETGFSNLEQAVEADPTEAGGNTGANAASIVVLNTKISNILTKLRLAGIIAD